MVIAFIGSVFSPYYAAARRRGPGDPYDHCAVNVALYGPRGKRWAMTERHRSALRQSSASLAIGPSALAWDGDGLTVSIDEWTVPLPGRLRGTVRVRPDAISTETFALDTAGRHRWRPIAPTARVEIEFDSPALRWSGSGYLDSNAGDRPLESDFDQWTWSRAPRPDGAAVLYDVQRRDGSSLSLDLQVARDGAIERRLSQPLVALPTTLWRVARSTRGSAPMRVLHTLEDAPFYARSALAGTGRDGATIAMHEALDLRRFSQRWVQTLLPFRMPRTFT